MGMPKKAIVVLIPSLLFGFGAPAWSGTAKQAAPTSTSAQVMPASPNSNSLLGMVNWLAATDTHAAPRKPDANCKASHLYSGHDVVGDPEACIMGQYTIGGPGVP
jgi:hypothetical protein